MSRPSKLEALSTLRFAAAAVVVFYHMGPQALDSAPEWLANIVGSGLIGIGLFFTLSGFVLSYLYYLSDTKINILDYTRVRFARIYPLYVAALVFSLPLYVSDVIEGTRTLAAAFAAPLLLQAWIPSAALAWNGPGWSLSVEVFLYLIFVPVSYFISRLDKNKIFVVLLGTFLMKFGIIEAVTQISYLIGSSSDAIHARAVEFSPIVYAPEFIAGISLGFLYLRHRLSVPGLGVVSGLFLLFLMSFDLSIPKSLLQGFIFMPIFALLIYGMADTHSGFMVWRPFVILGEISYALYLLHTPIWRYLNKAMPYVGLKITEGFGLIIYLIACMILSFLAYQIIERPGRRFVMKHTAQRTAR